MVGLFSESLELFPIKWCSGLLPLLVCIVFLHRFGQVLAAVTLDLHVHTYVQSNSGNKYPMGTVLRCMEFITN